MQVAPGKVGSNGERLPGRAVHLLRLLRGLTPAVIQDVAFSACGTLLTVSSARGTTHIYRLALPGEAERDYSLLFSCSCLSACLHLASYKRKLPGNKACLAHLLMCLVPLGSLPYTATLPQHLP